MAFGRGSSPITGSTIVSAGAIKNHPAMPESAIVAATPPPNEYAMRYRGASSRISSASRVSAAAMSTLLLLKSKRTTETPSGGSASYSALTTLLYRSPPMSGCGCSRTAYAQGLAASARS